MKNKNIFLWILLLAALIATYLPKIMGEKMILPEFNEVKSIEMEEVIDRKSQPKKIIEDREIIESLISNLSDNKKTVKTTSHDQPLETNYLSITLNYSDKSIRIYLYESHNKYYFEIPYTGIYKTNKEVMESIYKTYKN